MLLVQSVRWCAKVHDFLRTYMPTNILLRHLCTRRGLRGRVAVDPHEQTHLISACSRSAIPLLYGQSWP